MQTNQNINECVGADVLTNKSLAIDSRQEILSSAVLTTLSSFKLLAMLRLEQYVSGQENNDYRAKIKAELSHRGDKPYCHAPH